MAAALVRIACAAAGLSSLAACSDALDWRDVRPDGLHVGVAMPCRPDRQVRQLPLNQQPVTMTLLSCQVGSQTFSLGSADVINPAQVGSALQALGAATLVNLRGVVAADRPAAVPGMTPHEHARRQEITGQLPDGRPVHVQMTLFSHGTQVFQAMVMGPSASAKAGAPFEEALRVLP